MAKPTGNPNGRPLKFKTVEELEKAIELYYADCDEREMPYTVEGLAVACGCDRHTITNYGKREEFFATIKKHREKVLAQLAELAISGRGNPTSIIFNLKNNYDYTDKQEIKQDIDLKVKSLGSFYDET